MQVEFGVKKSWVAPIRGYIVAMTQTKFVNLRLEKIMRGESAETRKGLSFCFIILAMDTNYFLDNKLDCNKDNPIYVGYLADLKDLFLEVQKLTEDNKTDEAKDLLMDSEGKFSPNLYNISEEINDKNETIELYINFRKFNEELSSERVNDLTGRDLNISINRIKLFLAQELRLIDNLK